MALRRHLPVPAPLIVLILMCCRGSNAHSYIYIKVAGDLHGRRRSDGRTASSAVVFDHFPVRAGCRVGRWSTLIRSSGLTF